VSLLQVLEDAGGISGGCRRHGSHHAGGGLARSALKHPLKLALKITVRQQILLLRSAPAASRLQSAAIRRVHRQITQLGNSITGDAQTKPAQNACFVALAAADWNNDATPDGEHHHWNLAELLDAVNSNNIQLQPEMCSLSLTGAIVYSLGGGATACASVPATTTAPTLALKVWALGSE